MGILCEIYEVFQEYYKYKIKSATLSIHFGKQNQNWSMEINMHNFQKVSFYKTFLKNFTRFIFTLIGLSLCTSTKV